MGVMVEGNTSIGLDAMKSMQQSQQLYVQLRRLYMRRWRPKAPVTLTIYKAAILAALIGQHLDLTNQLPRITKVATTRQEQLHRPIQALGAELLVAVLVLKWHDIDIRSRIHHACEQGGWGIPKLKVTITATGLALCAPAGISQP